MKHARTIPRPPDAWLVVQSYGVHLHKVIGAFPSRDDPQLLALAHQRSRELPDASIEIHCDQPSLAVSHYGLVIWNPAWLRARDTWFERYESILEPHLREPRLAQVFTFSTGRLTDPLTTHKSSADGPFAFPRGADWPRCGFCEQRLAFLGTLDFRVYTALALPGSTLVLHICKECGACSNPETWSLTWLKEGAPIEIMGDSEKEVLVGTRWFATEYPLPATYAKDLVSTGTFLDEDSIYFNFSCFADKIGGHAFRIQGHYINDATPTDRQGNSMVYIGQFIGSADVEIGDTGIAYLYYSPGTGETVMEPEYF